MQGPGLWTLTNLSTTRRDDLDIQGGTLVTETDGTSTSIGSSAILLDGGTLGISASTTATFNHAMTLLADSGISALQSIPGGGAANQTITLPTVPAIPSPRKLTFGSYDGDTLNVTSAITGDGTLGTAGTSTIALSGDLSGFTGTIAPGGGTLKFNYAARQQSQPVTVSAFDHSERRKLTLNGSCVGTSTLTFDVADVVGQPVDLETNALNRISMPVDASSRPAWA